MASPFNTHIIEGFLDHTTLLCETKEHGLGAPSDISAYIFGNTCRKNMKPVAKSTCCGSFVLDDLRWATNEFVGVGGSVLTLELLRGISRDLLRGISPKPSLGGDVFSSISASMATSRIISKHPHSFTLVHLLRYLLLPQKIQKSSLRVRGRMYY